MTEDESIDEYESDVSLDEEDEELVGRVFYSGMQHQLDDDKLTISDDELVDQHDGDMSEITEEDLADIDDPELIERYKTLKSRKVDKNLNDEEKKRLMMSSFTEDQMDRFEAYRRTTINKPGVKKVCNAVLGHSIPQNIAVVLAGLSKLFLSEIITKAFEVQEREHKAQLILAISEKKARKRKALRNIELGLPVDQALDPNQIKLFYPGDYQTPLRPEHIREAVRLYKLETSSAITPHWRQQGEADGKFFR